MVDYSRFDDLAAELSDEEAAPGRPTVTKLDGAFRVTIGPTGASIAAQPAPTAPPAQPVRSRARFGAPEHGTGAWLLTSG